MSHERQVLPQVDVRWGRYGGGVCRCIMHLHYWGYLWHHCGWASAPKCGGRDSVGGRATTPMYDRRGSLGGRCTTPLCERRGSVCGRATAPMCCLWDSLASHYRWWQVNYHNLQNHVGATCRVVGDSLWCRHGTTSDCYAEKWI